MSGRFRYEAITVSDYPAVGDYVAADWSDENSNAVITELLPRKSCFIRKSAGPVKQEQVVAANIDTVFICMSLNNNFNLRRLERYLSITYDSGAIPVVILTKSDLCSDVESKIAEVENTAPGADIIAVSSLEGELDADRLESYRKLKKENKYAADNSKYLEAKRTKFKEISKLNKSKRKR